MLLKAWNMIIITSQNIGNPDVPIFLKKIMKRECPERGILFCITALSFEHLALGLIDDVLKKYLFRLSGKLLCS